MLSIIVFLFILSVLIIVHEFGHFIVAKKVGIKVEKFSLGFGPTLLRKKKDDTEYSVSAILLGGFIKMSGDEPQECSGKSDEFLSKPINQRAAVIFFGPLLNYVLGILFFWIIFALGYPTLTTKVGGVIEGLGAKDAGIRINDRITAVNGEKVTYWEDLQRTIQEKSNNSFVNLSVLRGDKEYSVDVRVKTKEFNAPLGGKHNVGLLGISPDDEAVEIKHGFIKSFFLSINKTWELTTLTYSGLWRMITGRLSVRESVTGPLGIFYITSKAASLGMIAVLHLMAVLSVSLAIFNLLPLPILDGGHIVLLLIEKIRGKRLSEKLDRIITQTGITALVTFALFVTYNDVVRFFGDKILKFFK